MGELTMMDAFHGGIIGCERGDVWIEICSPKNKHFCIEVIFYELEVISKMQDVSLLKQHQHQPQLPEYQGEDIHKNVVTENGGSDSLMQVKSSISGKVYSVHLEFSQDYTGIGEEIKNTLKEKYLQKELVSRQNRPSEVQFHSNEKQEVEVSE